MTDLTFAPFTIMGIIGLFILMDILMGTWSIWTTLELIGLLFFIGLCLIGPHLPTKTITKEELKEQDPELYKRLYGEEDSDICEKMVTKND